MSPTASSPLPAADTLAFVHHPGRTTSFPRSRASSRSRPSRPRSTGSGPRTGTSTAPPRSSRAGAAQRPIEGLKAETVRLPGRTPLLLFEVPGTSPETILLYGHCDKQPEMVGWADGLGPWTPVRRGEKLYGRGVQDDGYAAFCALTAIEAVQRAGAPHARCVVLIEGSEESGSMDLPAYMDALAGRLGAPDLVICLDSGCGNYDQLWGTTSLRGLVNGVLTVEVLTEGVHSGAASGIVPSSFRIARQILSRLEDERTGVIGARLPRRAAARAGGGGPRGGRGPGRRALRALPAGAGHALRARAIRSTLLLANTWAPALAITGAAGLPAPADGGNVLRPVTQLKLSLRIPPTLDAARATRRLAEILEADPPYGARVRYEASTPSPGWDAPATRPWLVDRRAGGVGAPLRPARDVQGAGRIDPVHGHAGRALPARPVLHHGHGRPGLERARPERVPARARTPSASPPAWPTWSPPTTAPGRG